MDEKRDRGGNLEKDPAGKPIPSGGSNVLKRLEALTGKPIAKSGRRSGGTVYLLVDCSGSMSDSGKLGQARSGARGFAQQAREQGYAIGLIRFASNAELLNEPATTLAEISAKLEKLAARGSTNLAEALAMGVDRLLGRPRPVALCVVTDGMPDDREAAIREADRAKAEGIDVLTIGTDDADYSLLERIASASHLAKKVRREQLAEAIQSTARLLPGGPEHSG